MKQVSIVLDGELYRFMDLEDLKNILEKLSDGMSFGVNLENSVIVDNEEREIIKNEENPMLHKITVTKTDEKVLEEYWTIKGIRDLIPPTNDLHVTREYKKEPTLEDIAQFLHDTNAKSVTVEHNYRFESDLPFC